MRVSRVTRSQVVVAAVALAAVAILALSAHFGVVPWHVGVGGSLLALTVPPTLAARNSGEQQIHFMRFRFLITQVPAFTAGVKVGRLPSRSFIHSIAWHKSIAFNSATTDTLQLGSTAAGVDILAATTIQGAGYVNHTAAAGLGVVVGTAGEQDIFAKYAQTGAVATTGDVTVIVAYIPDSDQ